VGAAASPVADRPGQPGAGRPGLRRRTFAAVQQWTGGLPAVRGSQRRRRRRRRGGALLAGHPLAGRGQRAAGRDRPAAAAVHPGAPRPHPGRGRGAPAGRAAARHLRAAVGACRSRYRQGPTRLLAAGARGRGTRAAAGPRARAGRRHPRGAGAAHLRRTQRPARRGHAARRTTGGDRGGGSPAHRAGGPRAAGRRPDGRSAVYLAARGGGSRAAAAERGVQLRCRRVPRRAAAEVGAAADAVRDDPVRARAGRTAAAAAAVAPLRLVPAGGRRGPAARARGGRDRRTPADPRPAARRLPRRGRAAAGPGAAGRRADPAGGIRGAPPGPREGAAVLAPAGGLVRHHLRRGTDRSAAAGDRRRPARQSPERALDAGPGAAPASPRVRCGRHRRTAVAGTGAGPRRRAGLRAGVPAGRRRPGVSHGGPAAPATPVPARIAP